MISWRLPIGLLLFVGFSTIASAQQFNIKIEQFDQWIFQGMRTASQAQIMLETKIDIEIDRIEQSTTLRETQKERIRLAGRGDIKRFFDRVESARRDFRALGDKLNKNNINEAYQLAVPLQQELTKGIFARDSLLKKVANSTVDAKQAEALRQLDERQRKLRTEALIKAYVAQLGRQIPMTASQRDRLLEVARSSLESMETTSQNASYLIPYRLSLLPQKEFAAIFDPPQLNAWKQVMQQGKAMKPFLQQRGLLDDE